MRASAIGIADACVGKEVACWCVGHFEDGVGGWWDTSQSCGITEGHPMPRWPRAR